MNLLASSLWGGLYLVILFGICFALVVGIKAARIRADEKKKRAEEAEKTRLSKEKPAEKKEESSPVYYIVEKKRAKRPQAKYSEPKKIRFE